MSALLNDTERAFASESLLIIRDLSQQILADTLKCPCRSQSEIPATMPRDHWITMAEADLGAASIYLKAHYQTSVARTLAARKLACDNQNDLATSLCFNVINEFLGRILATFKAEFTNIATNTTTVETKPSYDLVSFNPAAWQGQAGFWQLQPTLAPEAPLLLTAFVYFRGDINALRENRQTSLKKRAF